MLAGSFAGLDLGLPDMFGFAKEILKKCFLLILVIMVLVIIGFLLTYFKPK
jgi:hypothetical protein